MLMEIWLLFIAERVESWVDWLSVSCVSIEIGLLRNEYMVERVDSGVDWLPSAVCWMRSDLRFLCGVGCELDRLFRLLCIALI